MTTFLKIPIEANIGKGTMIVFVNVAHIIRLRPNEDGSTAIYFSAFKDNLSMHNTILTMDEIEALLIKAGCNFPE